MNALLDKPAQVPAWVDKPVGEWPIAFACARDGMPDRFILGAEAKPLQPEMRALVLLDPNWRTDITVDELVSIAAGAYAAVAQKDCDRAAAEALARAWLVLAAPFENYPTPGRRVVSHVLH